MDFFGTSPFIYVNTIFQSIASTFDEFLPIFVLVGVPIGFYILNLLIGFIRSAFTDRSYKLFGVFYIREVPYKGYNRWRSEEWNRRNTM